MSVVIGIIVCLVIVAILQGIFESLHDFLIGFMSGTIGKVFISALVVAGGFHIVNWIFKIDFFFIVGNIFVALAVLTIVIGIIKRIFSN